MKKVETKKYADSRAITLIALIITIIIMLILVTVSIQIALNTGLFDTAGKATKETRQELAKEHELTNIPENATVNDLIEKYTGKEVDKKLPDDFYVYEDTEKTILVGINSDYLVQGTDTASNNMKEGVKVASLKPIVIADDTGNTPEDKYYTVKYNEEKITKMTIPEGVVKICENAFSYHLITEVVLPSTLKEIEKGAFSNCKTLEKVVIPSNVTKMGNGVFNYSTGSVYVSFISNEYRPSDWEYYWYASGGVNNHSEVIYATVNSDGIFRYADTDKTILIGIKEEYLVKDSEVTGNNLKEGIKIASLQPIRLATETTTYYKVVVDGVQRTKIEIPEGVIKIGEGALEGLLITEITLPSTLRTIEEYAFAECKLLEKITIPSTVTDVYRVVLNNSTGIVTVSFKENETPDGWEAAWNSGFKGTVQYAQ